MRTAHQAHHHPSAHLKPRNKRTNRIRQLRCHRPYRVPVRRQARAHARLLRLREREVEQHREGVRVLRAERGGGVVAVHARAFEPERGVVRLLERGGVLRPGCG
jgi:hypothetical protein